MQELVRVAPRGYIEFPTVYYEYLYNFREHLNLMVYKDGELRWMPKCETTLNDFDPVQQFLRATLESGYDDMIQMMKESFFQGFEWSVSIRSRRVSDMIELIPCRGEVQRRMARAEPRSRLKRAGDVWRSLRRRIQKLRSASHPVA
jgi:hypothetical protein